MRRSEEKAVLQEKKDVQEAILRNNIDRSPDFGDEALLLRVNPFSNKVPQVIHDSQRFAHLIDDVKVASCGVSPEWPGGAMFLAPLHAHDIPIH